jgi:ABC-type iron transport system FetAB permease component
MNEIINNKEAIELHLSFGASRWETARPICVHGIKLALLPILNSQSVMGLISIPGMTTGQILGGVPVQDAINYQLIVTFMYVATAGLAVVFTVLGAVYSVFDGQSRLRLDRIEKRPTVSWKLIKKSFKTFFKKNNSSLIP